MRITEGHPGSSGNKTSTREIAQCTGSGRLSDGESYSLPAGYGWTTFPRVPLHPGLLGPSLATSAAQHHSKSADR
eukprot:1843106-Pyramimonas_sp.AAC.1